VLGRLFLLVALAAAIFLLDLSLPLGVAGGVPYVALVLAGWRFGTARPVVLLALLSTALTVLGYALSPPGGVEWIVLTNRGLALGAIWVTAGVLVKAVASAKQRQKARERLKEVEAQLRQAQKLEAVGQLAGGLAHDLNNQLMVIKGYLEMLTEAASLEKAKALLRAPLKSVDQGALLIQALLAFSRKQVLQPGAVDVQELVEGMLDLLRRTLGATVELELEATDGHWKAEVDPHQLEIAILNLSLNSRHAMPSGGALSFSITNTAASLNLMSEAGGAVPAGEFVLLSVRDTGVGMSPEIMGKIFEPFFTTRPVGEGSGLGMSMVHGFVNQSGGQVVVDSTVGEGTTIQLFLPRSLAG
jgi:signal transduction histidine kinase